MNKYDRLLAEGENIPEHKKKEMHTDIIPFKGASQLVLPYELDIKILRNKWMSQTEMEKRSKDVMDFIRKER